MRFRFRTRANNQCNVVHDSTTKDGRVIATYPADHRAEQSATVLRIFDGAGKQVAAHGGEANARTDASGRLFVYREYVGSPRLVADADLPLEVRLHALNQANAEFYRPKEEAK